MVKYFSKKYGYNGRAFNYMKSESYVKMPVSPDATSLHHCLMNKQLQLIYGFNGKDQSN